jgi:hypothetical protein
MLSSALGDLTREAREYDRTFGDVVTLVSAVLRVGVEKE